MTDHAKFSESPARGGILAGVSACGVIFDAGSETSRAFLKGFLLAAQPFGFPLTLLGWDKKKNVLPALDISYDSAKKNDFNLWGRAKKGSRVAAFADKEFDLLVDLSLCEESRIRKIVRIARARFKIGVNKTSEPFDFRFTLPEEARPTPDAFDELLTCLGKIDLARP